MAKTKIQRDEKGRFKKGFPSWNKGKPHLKIREENHYRWKGGSRSTAKQILIRNKVDLTTCGICKEKIKTIIHHIDGNMHNNKLNNLAVICYFCHNAMHGTGIKTRFQIGHKTSMEIRKKISKANKGKHFSPLTEFKIGDKAHLGHFKNKSMEVIQI